MSRSTTLERTRLVIDGVRAELVLEDGRITITKEGPTQAAPSTVSVDVDRLRGTSLNSPSRGGRGWIHVAVAGGSPTPPSELAAAGDPYTVPITSRATSAARRFARLVDKHVAERGMPSDPRVGGRQLSSGVSLVDPPDPDGGQPETRDEPHRLVAQLRELADLHDAGALTDEEFERAKSRLLR